MQIGRRGGFTLIEVLIVIAILLAIGGLVVVNLLPAKDKADIDLQRVQFDLIGRAMDQFKLDMKRYPNEEEGLRALSSKNALTNEDDQVSWRGPYLQDPVVNDKWNRPLAYQFPGPVVGQDEHRRHLSGRPDLEGRHDAVVSRVIQRDAGPLQPHLDEGARNLAPGLAGDDDIIEPGLRQPVEGDDAEAVDRSALFADVAVGERNHRPVVVSKQTGARGAACRTCALDHGPTPSVRDALDRRLSFTRGAVRNRRPQRAGCGARPVDAGPDRPRDRHGRVGTHREPSRRRQAGVLVATYARS
jgi:general secretion pathway protein G